MTSSRFVSYLMLVVATMGVACGSGPEVHEPHQTHSLRTDLRLRAEAASRGQVFAGLPGLLDNVRYQYPGEEPSPATSAVVTGRIATVEPGAGFRIDGDDAAGGTLTSFDDPHALWRTLHVQLVVDEILSGELPDRSLEFGIATGPNVEVQQAESELKEMGTLLIFLYSDSDVFRYDDSLFATTWDGNLIGSIDERGSISLPYLHSDLAQQLLESASTLTALREAAARRPVTVQVDADGGVTSNDGAGEQP